MSFGILFGLVCQGVIVALVGGVILRASCALYNRLFASPGAISAEVVASQVVQYTTTEAGPYTSPAIAESKPVRGVLGTNAVPEPSFPLAMGINLIAFFVQTVMGVGLLALVPIGPNRGFNPVMITLLIVTVPVSFCIFAGLLAALLPTKFGRAALVTLFHWLIAFVVALVMGLILAAVAMAIRFG